MHSLQLSRDMRRLGKCPSPWERLSWAECSVAVCSSPDPGGMCPASALSSWSPPAHASCLCHDVRQSASTSGHLHARVSVCVAYFHSIGSGFTQCLALISCSSRAVLDLAFEQRKDRVSELGNTLALGLLEAEVMRTDCESAGSLLPLRGLWSRICALGARTGLSYVLSALREKSAGPAQAGERPLLRQSPPCPRRSDTPGHDRTERSGHRSWASKFSPLSP
ncbi:hypothetical protein AAFF_G00153380 [Aldrovandia affinis]|uniref:Uncharacterized protein n=1 Tax=Aldrovandia affinis TaxID=143900 RepID=A0AAD7SZW2_9TELE|nr:hypothetical protein AAFF_G00153380 [Aldrovandia affinis]